MIYLLFKIHILSLIYKTNKFEIHGEEYFKNAQDNNKPILLCVWHGRMLYPIFYVIKNKIKTWALASPHRDGAMMGNILSKWGIKIIKGSKANLVLLDSKFNLIETYLNGKKIDLK